MNKVKVVGLVILVLGVVGLVVGGLTYTEEKHQADLGPIEFSVKEKERVNIPQWASIAAIAVGAGILVFGGRSRG
jgi:hypothetical protein